MAGKILATGGIALALCACVTRPLPPREEPVTDIRVLSPRAVVLEVPFEGKATPNMCGLAAVEMLTRYYNRPLENPERAAIEDEIRRDKSVTAGFVKTVLERAGYQVAVFPGTLDREITGLYRHIDLRRPLVVLLEPPGGAACYWLVIGYDPEREMIVVLDPVRGPLAVARQTFSTSWAAKENLTILALPAEKDGEPPKKP